LRDTGIVAKNYNPRGLITHNADTRALVRQSDGTLWAAIKEDNLPDYLSIYRSTDEGFSWQGTWAGNFTNPSFRKVGLGNNNTNGCHLSLQVFEAIDRLILWQSYYDITTEKYNCEPFTWALSNPTVRLTNSPHVGTVTLLADSLALDVVHNDKQSWLLYTSNSRLVVTSYRPLYQIAPERTVQHFGTFFDIFQGVAHKDSYIDIAILEDLTSSYALRHVRHYALEGTFTSTHNIHDVGYVADVTDVGIARDGHENLCVVWAQPTEAGDNIDAYFSISTNEGVSWTAPQKISKELGHSAYQDPATARLAIRTRVLGGVEGFMLSYCHRNPAGVGKTFVRTLLTTDGTTYTVGDQRQIATSAPADEVVAGLSWFRPPSSTLLPLSDPGLIRVGYQIGEGDTRVQVSAGPVRIVQEPLSSSAYPSSLPSEAGSYLVEPANGMQLGVGFNVLGAPNSNIDYYAVGLVGHVTGRYQSAFRKVGTEMRFQRFDPIQSAELNDRTSYSSPTEETSLAVLDPQSYQFPVLGQRGPDNYEAYIERDVRQLYMPPDMHLERVFLINAGNFLKRTVWLVDFDGNQYEVSQVVPYFLDGQLAYYGANAYVVGPSNDPFSRPVLPSET
jgi:hypothetical protein